MRRANRGVNAEDFNAKRAAGPLHLEREGGEVKMMKTAGFFYKFTGSTNHPATWRHILELPKS
jgi:hypothetical protein